MQTTGDRSANALKKELVVRVEATTTAAPDTVYGVLAELSSHLVWAGERQAKKTRLLDDRRGGGARGRGDGMAEHGCGPDRHVLGPLGGDGGDARQGLRVRHRGAC